MLNAGQIIQQKKQIRAEEAARYCRQKAASRTTWDKRGTDHQMSQIMDILTEAGAVTDRGGVATAKAEKVDEVEITSGQAATYYRTGIRQRAGSLRDRDSAHGVSCPVHL